MHHAILSHIKKIEDYWKYTLPLYYQKVLIHIIQDQAIFEVECKENEEDVFICFYNAFDLIERNKTYQIQVHEPHYLMIGQEGDQGYFISNIENDLTLYCLDLGAIGRLDMQPFTQDLNILFL
ncbi:MULTISPECIES: hypothetical protein [unclassified Acinetobacter]|uniref:hypothetical protein n=1 Tax=unclassified Acinetobacter TaxID=196816 RepID=UPI002574A49D|nr:MULTISPECIES: hypothetical protein [unclassified Acinetobacter]MDM1765386.1 SMI1/KNR4 family protein [Acinetobacter sp. 226-1]MDM1768891.1 SMI1/KNR4 family protein [Acinetobacter sp. 226-4]